MLRNMRIASRAGTAKVKVPSSLMLVPSVEPVTDTCPDVTGSEVNESTTFPVTIRVCAGAALANSKPMRTAPSKLRLRPLRHLHGSSTELKTTGMPAVSPRGNTETLPLPNQLPPAKHPPPARGGASVSENRSAYNLAS